MVQELLPSVTVYASSEVNGQFREFERISTASVNAYVGPVVGLYLSNLGKKLDQLGIKLVPAVLKCDGGVASVEEARRVAVSTIGSGPAAGVRGAMLVSRQSGSSDNLLTLDMGGTSTDVSLVLNGNPMVTDQRNVNGWPIKGSATDIESIGAGGGSIAWVDNGGLLQVGPSSAGSTPGPACYGRGGTLPTITDANAVLGRISSLVGGEIQLDIEAARRAIDEHVAKPLGLSVEAAALGILQVATANMVQAIRLITVERGWDPREFLLIAFGGAGPLHAPIVARTLGIRRCFVPADGGVLSAMGALLSDVTKDFATTKLRLLDEERLDDVRHRLNSLLEQGVEWMMREGHDVGFHAELSRLGA